MGSSLAHITPSNITAAVIKRQRKELRPTFGTDSIALMHAQALWHGNVPQAWRSCSIGTTRVQHCAMQHQWHWAHHSLRINGMLE
jgi:hypothetical protein